MAAYQLDRNINSKKLAEECNREGKARTYRYPHALASDAKDPDVLAYSYDKRLPLVTLDRSIAHDHVKSLQSGHPGVIIVNNERSPVFPMTVPTRYAAASVRVRAMKLPGTDSSH